MPGEDTHQWDVANQIDQIESHSIHIDYLAENYLT